MATYGGYYPIPYDERSIYDDDPPPGPLQAAALTPGFRAPALPSMGAEAPATSGMGGMDGIAKLLAGLKDGGGGGGGLGSILGGGASSGGGGGGGFGGGGFGGSPWDLGFSMLGRLHGAAEGNNPNTPFVHHNRQPTDREWMVNAGAPIGGAIGSIWGMPGVGMLAGQNAGATLADLTSGNIHNLGYDLSSNLPPLPGFQAEGWKGIANAATGLPFGTLFGKLFG
jgi:hypothetical protein